MELNRALGTEACCNQRAVRFKDAHGTRAVIIGTCGRIKPMHLETDGTTYQGPAGKAMCSCF